MSKGKEKESIFYNLSLFNRQILKNAKNHPEYFLTPGFLHPTINIEQFLCRLHQVFKFDFSYYYATFLLLDKINQKNVKITYGLSYKLILTCLYIVEKIIDQDGYSLLSYSLAAGITKDDIVQLEKQILEIIQYRTFISDDQYIDFERKINNLRF